MVDERERGDSESSSDEVTVTATKTGPDRFRIDATTSIGAGAEEVWSLLWDWEHFLAVGLPGVTSDFTWLTGGPDTVPSTFRFTVGDATLHEEIYERWADADAGRYRLRYRVLQPALGILEYDAVFELASLTGALTAFSAVREVRLEPRTEPDALAGLIESETQCLREHFASRR